MEDFINCQSCKYFKENRINNNSILYTCEKKSKKDLPEFGTILTPYEKSLRTCFVDKNKKDDNGGKRKWRKHSQQKSSKKS